MWAEHGHKRGCCGSMRPGERTHFQCGPKGSVISIVPFATPSVNLVWLLSRRVNDTGGPRTLPSDTLQSKTGRC